jgi:hypothetical protein
VDNGLTQGDIVSPTVFNIVADAIIRTWTWETMGNVAATTAGDNVAGYVGAELYADDGALASTSVSSLQGSTDHLVSLFERVKLYTTPIHRKKKAMMCTPSPSR